MSGRPPNAILAGPLTGSEMIWVMQGGRWKLAPISAVLALAPVSPAEDFDERFDEIEAAIAGESASRKSADDAGAARDQAHDVAIAAGVARDDAQDVVYARMRFVADETNTVFAAAIAALEAKPEEVVHFTATINPGLVTIAGKRQTVKNLRGLKAGDQVVVSPVDAWPVGVTVAGRMVADGELEVSLTAAAALTLPTPLPIAISALR